MRAILAELDTPDQEHPSTWLSDDAEWTLSIYESGLVVWENGENEEGGEPRYQEGLSREASLRLWQLLVAGNYAEIEQEPWKDGYGPPISDEELQRLKEESDRILREIHRKFYDSLGPEDAARQCLREGCQRGTVAFSAFCRPHQFENVRKEPCPFDD
ncbi:hypothetical protein [Haloferula sp. BvORR071]|uniref:hypothetical protein n=1 Tax=Haloferula sp. BvORR071 TaxID=1396141 RepID=UPI0005507A8A|nr:hypothetical protein [Haloferula sp. BvORR071]